MAEREVKDWLVSSNMLKSTRPGKAVILRYFNVIGADPLSRVGERVYQKPGTYEYRKNVRLSSAMFDAAEGLLEKFTVAGGRYETPDGSPVKDYIHVTDLMNAHVVVLHRFASYLQRWFWEAFLREGDDRYRPDRDLVRLPRSRGEGEGRRPRPGFRRQYQDQDGAGLDSDVFEPYGDTRTPVGLPQKNPFRETHFCRDA